MSDRLVAFYQFHLHARLFIRYATPRIIVIVTLALAFAFFVKPNPGMGIVKTASAEGSNKLSLEFITLADALTLYYYNNSVFIDARSAEDFKRGHISGAFSVSLEDAETLTESKIQSFAKYPNIVVYCYRNCGSAPRVAQLLRNRGLRSVKVYKNGWDEWSLLKEPITAERP